KPDNLGSDIVAVKRAFAESDQILERPRRAFQRRCLERLDVVLETHRGAHEIGIARRTPAAFAERLERCRQHDFVAPRDPAEQRTGVSGSAAIEAAARQKNVEMTLDLAFENLNVVRHGELLVRFPCRIHASGPDSLRASFARQWSPPCACATSRTPSL